MKLCGSLSMFKPRWHAERTTYLLRDCSKPGSEVSGRRGSWHSTQCGIEGGQIPNSCHKSSLCAGPPLRTPLEQSCIPTTYLYMITPYGT